LCNDELIFVDDHIDVKYTSFLRARDLVVNVEIMHQVHVYCDGSLRATKLCTFDILMLFVHEAELEEVTTSRFTDRKHHFFLNLDDTVMVNFVVVCFMYMLPLRRYRFTVLINLARSINYACGNFTPFTTLEGLTLPFQYVDISFRHYHDNEFLRVFICETYMLDKVINPFSFFRGNLNKVWRLLASVANPKADAVVNRARDHLVL